MVDITDIIEGGFRISYIDNTHAVVTTRHQNTYNKIAILSEIEEW